jgi:uncharacterized protein (UPF0218 family)
LQKSKNTIVVKYKLTKRLRSSLKKPWGILIRGSSTETISELKNIINRRSPPTTIIAVGDAISQNLQEKQVTPAVTIIDNMCKRKETGKIFTGTKSLRVRNPAGTITEEAEIAIQKAISSKENVQIIVEGEEDLLTLIAVLYAPRKSLVAYGQPNEGIVVVKVTEKKKAEAKKILEEMKTFEKLNKKATYEVNAPKQVKGYGN